MFEHPEFVILNERSCVLIVLFFVYVMCEDGFAIEGCYDIDSVFVGFYK